MHATQSLPDTNDDRHPLPIDDAGHCYRDTVHFEETMTRVAREQMGPAVFERYMSWFVVAGLVTYFDGREEGDRRQARKR